MEEVEDTVVAERKQAQGPDETGDTEKIVSDTEAEKDQDHPEESS